MASMYERAGGASFFDGLIDRFYAGVDADPILRPLYPPDLEPSKDHLRMFLVQYWGGPRTYGEVRGHPRLRMRHAPFAIGLPERDAWLSHMEAAVRAAGLPAEDEAEMLDYFRSSATQLINTMGRR